MIDRRTLLKGLATTPLWGLAGCGPPTRAPLSFEQEGVFLGLFPTDAREAAKTALAGQDLSWLSPGDSVLIKVACNSGNRHPAVTSPLAVQGLCEALRDAGAGRVIVADQAGVEQVRLVAGNQRFSATRDQMARNGLLQAIVDGGGEPHFFDDQDFDGGYFAATLPFESFWTEDMFVPAIIREVDHIVYAPRISSHILCGYTHGHKSAMGWLRDDSRFHVHHQAEYIYEKYVEINYCTEIAEKFRLAITVADAALLHSGPDFGTVKALDRAIVIASPSLCNHDAVGVAILAHLESQTPARTAFNYGSGASLVNFAFMAQRVKSATGIPWGTGAAGYTPYNPHHYQAGVRSDRALQRGYDLTGGVPSRVRVRLVGEVPDAEMRSSLEDHAHGVLALE